MTRIEAIRQALADRPAILRTHWDGCDTEARHADCAIAFLLDELERRDAALRALVGHLDESVVATEKYPGVKSNAETYRYIRAKLSRLLKQAHA